MKSVISAFVVSFVLASVTHAAQTSGIQNFLRINAELCTGGQPTLAQLAELKAQGITAVVSLRAPGEPGFDPVAEKAEVERLGMKWFHIPVSNQEGAKDEQADQFLKITDEAANRPVYVHCGSASRAGGFAIIRRVLRDGLTFDAAKAEAQKTGWRSTQVEAFARQYIDKHAK